MGLSLNGAIAALLCPLLQHFQMREVQVMGWILQRYALRLERGAGVEPLLGGKAPQPLV